MITTGMLIASGVAVGALILLSGTFVIIKKLVKQVATLKKAVIKHEAHLFGKESAAKLAKEAGKVSLIKRHSKKVKKIKDFESKIADVVSDL